MSDSADLQLTGWRWALALTLLLLVSLLPAVTALDDRLALEFHEVYVARTAQEMLDGGHLIVPVFSGKPRVNKPPLPYWLVMLVDRVRGADGQVTAAEARAPSLIAGVALVFLTLGIGVTLFDRAIGLLGALLAAGSVGYISFMHSARPEMLYAAAIALAVLGYASAWRNVQRKRSTRWANLVTLVGLALATMTKGPYVPLALILALALYLRLTGQRRHLGRVLLPWTSLAVVLVAFLWWYALMYVLTPDAILSWRDEFAERLDTGQRSWWTWIDPFYLYSTGFLVLPWAVLYAGALAAPWIRPLRGRPGVMMLWSVTVVEMAVWQALPGRRMPYTLPVLPALCPLLAVAAVAAAEELRREGKRRLWRVLLAAHALALPIAALAAALLLPKNQWPPALGVVLLALASLVVCVLACRRPPIKALVMVAGLAPAMFLTLTHNASLWDQERQLDRVFDFRVLKHVGPGDTLVGWRRGWDFHQFYLRRIIPELSDEKLAATIQEHDRLFVLTTANLKPMPFGQWTLLEEVDVGRRRRERDVNQLYLVTRP